MACQKLLLDTNIIIDFVHRREPYFEKARLLMLAGRVGEFSLWISALQVMDLIYILTEGGKPGKVAEILDKLRALRTFVNVCPVDAGDVDGMLATRWSDPEDALLVDIALRLKADAIITRDNDFPQTDMIRVQNCDEFFDWLHDEKGISYDDVML